MFVKINFEALLSVPVVITFIIALLFSIFFISIDYREKKDEAKTDEDRNKKKSFYRLRLFFTFLLGLCAVYEAYNHKVHELRSTCVQAKQDSTITAKQDLNTAITIKLDSTSDKLNEKNDALIAAQKDINKTQAHTIGLQNELLNQLNGGNSVAFLQIEIRGRDYIISSEGMPLNSQYLQLYLRNWGEYPIQNVSLSYYMAEDRRQIKQNLPVDHINQKPIARIRFGDPPPTDLLQNLHLYPTETKPIKSFKLDYDTTNLISVSWIVNVFWRNINYKYKFKTIPPTLIGGYWTIKDLSVSSDGKELTDEQLIKYIQKKLEIYKN